MIEDALVGERVRLRPVRAGDGEVLIRIFADPTVVQWWGDAEESLDGALHPGEDESGWVIEVDSDAVGYVMCSEDSDPMYRHAGIDIALRADAQGQGLGRDAVVTLARHLFAVRGHHRLTIDPAVRNHRAIRAYQRIGFKPVGVMRQYERGPGGEWHDGLLMDLLAEDLVVASAT
jgi:aminoglycoside 6'-N-acetyltransferase